MTNDETILKEVDQALAEDQTSDAIRKQLPLIIGAALLIVAGVGGWQYWSASKAAKAAKNSAALDLALKDGDEASRDKALEAIAANGGGYGAVANLRLAADRAQHGEREAALKLYREVYASRGATKRLKDVARLRAGYLSLADGRDKVLQDVGPLETDTTALGFYARELIAIAALDAGDYQSAEEMFRKAASSPDAPEPIKLRAGEFAALAGAGKAGVKFPEIVEDTKSQTERYLEGLEQAGEDLSSVIGPASQTPSPQTETAAPVDSADAPADQPAQSQSSESQPLESQPPQSQPPQSQPNE